MYYVYILADKLNRTIYTGVTNDLLRRVYEHKHNADINSFTARYNVHKLVYYEETPSRYEAISREKQLKKWRREKKNILISRMNPEWADLSASWE